MRSPSSCPQPSVVVRSCLACWLQRGPGSRESCQVRRLGQYLDSALGPRKNEVALGCTGYPDRMLVRLCSNLTPVPPHRRRTGLRSRTSSTHSLDWERWTQGELALMRRPVMARLLARTPGRCRRHGLVGRRATSSLFHRVRAGPDLSTCLYTRSRFLRRAMEVSPSRLLVAREDRC